MTPLDLLRLTAPATFGELYLDPAIAAIMVSHPQVALKAVSTDRFVSLVDDGFDL